MHIAAIQELSVLISLPWSVLLTRCTSIFYSKASRLNCRGIGIAFGLNCHCGPSDHKYRNTSNFREWQNDLQIFSIMLIVMHLTDIIKTISKLNPPGSEHSGTKTSLQGFCDFSNFFLAGRSHFSALSLNF